MLTRVGPQTFELDTTIGLTFFLRGKYTLKTRDCYLHCDQYRMKPNTEINVSDDGELYNQITVSN